MTRRLAPGRAEGGAGALTSPGLRPWLYAIATHQAVDALRKSGRHPTVSLDQRINPARSESEAGNLVDLLVSDNVGPLAELQDSERQQWVRESIARLPDALRQTLILAYHQDLKYREIAEILKCEIGAVKVRVYRATRELSQIFYELSGEKAS